MEDEKIVQLYWDRDEEAIPATARKYGQYCAAIARNILGSREDAEECVNDTYLNAWNAMPPHRPRVLSTFLGRIVRNVAVKRWRRSTAEKRGGGSLPVPCGCRGAAGRRGPRRGAAEQGKRAHDQPGGAAGLGCAYFSR